MGIFFWDFKTFNKRSRLLVVNQFLQTNMNVSVANFKYKNYGIQNYQHSLLVLLYNIAKSKKANLQGMAACLAVFHTLFLFTPALSRQPRFMERFEVDHSYSFSKLQHKRDSAWVKNCYHKNVCVRIGCGSVDLVAYIQTLNKRTSSVLCIENVNYRIISCEFGYMADAN